MKNEIEENKNELKVEKIGRRDALKKSGKYAVITASATFLILSPKSEAGNSAGPFSNESVDDGWSLD